MPRKGGPKSSVRRISEVEKAAEALELRKAGLGFDAIAAALGYASRSGAHSAVMTALRSTVSEPAEELRTLELERLDALLAAIWGKCMGGDTWSIDRVLRIMERRSQLLGLDRPAKLDLTHSTPPVADVLGEAERLLGLSGAGGFHAQPNIPDLGPGPAGQAADRTDA